MITDPALVKMLNLPRTSPSFAYRQRPEGSLNVVNPNLIRDDGAIYWVAGKSTLPQGQSIPSVFIIENGGKDFLAVYWYIEGLWYRTGDPHVMDSLGLPKDDVFPFDLIYAIPVSNDAFQD